jgi:hypothetical protein
MLQFFAPWFTPRKACKGPSFMKKSGNTLGSRPRGSLILVKAVVSGFTLHFIRVHDGGFESTGPMLRAQENPLFGESSPTLDPYSTPRRLFHCPTVPCILIPILLSWVFFPSQVRCYWEHIENLTNMLGTHWELDKHVGNTLGTWQTCWEHVGNKNHPKSHPLSQTEKGLLGPFGSMLTLSSLAPKNFFMPTNAILYHLLV